MSAVNDLDRYILISADTHAGADLQQYRPYLEKKWHAEFDEWVAIMEEQQAQMRERMGSRSVGVDGDFETDGNRNWDTDRRIRESEAEGIVAEVVFPNTQLPFSPSASTFFEAPQMGDDPERRWAGYQAHNRWLVDFCNEAPGRRAGITQIFLQNIEGALEEIKWAKEQGLTGGILVPGCPPGGTNAPLYAPEYEPIWELCADLEMPLNHHAGGATPDFGPYYPSSLAMFMLEVKWWTHRALWHLMFSGVFERHPNLQFVLTETGTAWAPDKLAELDDFASRMGGGGQGSETIFGKTAVAGMTMLPSEYFERQCHIGASFLRPFEADLVVDKIGVNNVMWGSDYPHIEGCTPFTREHLRLTFEGIDSDTIQKLVGGNAAKLYNFDMDFLATIAAKVGPLKSEIAQPFNYEELPTAATKCPGMQPQNQRDAA